ncbi:MULTISPECIES: intermembrane transport protein PqiB [unclassified Achromobacter]|uniref:PqiB family protein n=1 Tax=unclassified Achromobacter TaxID=2626865 RepID=UPI000B51CABB|nr:MULTISPECIES: MlaD family protein [unclassified Achromobacter]OWT75532.1 mammalian cell entry protein [Achromobacter sp. HZ28]OWT76193.1 mammalian cell entry protein [Achromobacter sp. HZ34]
MPDPDAGRDDAGTDAIPEAVARPPSRWGVQLVWLVPLIAIVIGGWLAARAILEKGPTITISFATGEGLEAGKTKIKFKSVDIGVINSVDLAPDNKKVIATAELAKSAANLLVEDTRFWVVSPRISGGSVSGLGTLLSGSYIGMDNGSQTRKRRDFTGLEEPPVFTSDVPGREYVLKSETLGSLDVGAPVYFRRLKVGQVISYALDAEGEGIVLHVFVNAPYDRYVKPGTRFWHASGVDVSLDSSGIRVETQSLVSVIGGGLAFQNPPEAVGANAADANSEFTLFMNRTDAMKRQDRIADTYIFNFRESVRGLAVGAPVDFRGIVIGEVTGIYTRFDASARDFSIPVEVRIYPERFTSRYVSGSQGGRLARDPRQMAQWLVENGLRGQLRTGNLLTGQLYVAMDFFPKAPKASVTFGEGTPELPTTPGNLQSLQDSITGLVDKFNKLPLDDIGKDLRQGLKDASALMKTLNTSVAPDARAALLAARTALESANRSMQPVPALLQGTAETMRDLARMAASIRALADYLERHPEALLRGKPEIR